MKNEHYLKLFMIIAIIAVVGIAMVSCGGGGGKANPASDFSYDMTADGQGILIKQYTGGPGTVVVPAKIENLPVLEIGEDAFNGKSITFSIDVKRGTADTGSKTNEKAGITSITIPNTVRKIGKSAFANTAITKFIMPDSVTEIDHSGSGASFLFSDCKALTEVRFSDNIEVFPNQIFGFMGAPVLKKANLPKNLKVIAEFAFTACVELTELTIPDTIKSLEFVNIVQNYFGGKNPKYPLGDDPRMGFGIATEANNFHTFNGCGKLPLATRQKLKDFGYKGEF